MKKIITSISALAVLVSFAYAQGPIDRTVLNEYFTNTGCGPCATYTPAFLTLVNPFMSSEEVARIQYHGDWPSSSDPLYLFNATDHGSRKTFYSNTSYPNAGFNGTFNHPASWTSADVSNLVATGSPANIELIETKAGNDVTFIVRVTAAGNIPASTVHIAIVEDEVTYATAPGSNGETEFHQVLRTFIGGATGDPLPAQSAGAATVQYVKSNAYTLPAAGGTVDPNELRTVVFIQNSATNEIVQSIVGTMKTGDNAYIANAVGFDDVDANSHITVYPNPASDEVNVSMELNETTNISIELTNGLGQVVKTLDAADYNSGNSVVTINTSDLASGMYMVNLKSDGDVITKKFFVQ